MEILAFFSGHPHYTLKGKGWTLAMQGNLVTILKDGKLTLIDEDKLCLDDLVILQAGDIVPADLRLMEVKGLEVDEFDVTGEIMPVIKKVNEQADLLYMGSRVIHGTGKGVVIATGEQTEFGRVLKQSWEHHPPKTFRLFDGKSFYRMGLFLPAFVILLTQTTHPLAVLVFVMVVFLFLIVFQNEEYLKQRLITDEQKKCEQLNIQLRDPEALESLTKIDLICFDKTGVLTSRHMEVINFYYADISKDPGLSHILEKPPVLINLACALCNEVLFLEKIELANPIDKALIAFAKTNGVDLDKIHTEYNRIYDQPFDSENRYMACRFERENNDAYYFIKGDPGVIINRCTQYMTSTGAMRAVDFNFFISNSSNIERITQNGDTVIALAFSPGLSDQPLENLTFLCLLQLSNPLQPGAQQVITSVTKRGIRSILLTGDRSETAVVRGRECGITKNPRAFLTGRTIQYMALSEVARQSAYISVFARLLPSQKGVLIRLFQQKGYTVAMIGDGANDGIALKAADIGISYLKDSSPLARRVSKILINDLADVVKLMERSERLNRKLADIDTLWLTTMIGLWVIVYAWVLALYFSGESNLIYSPFMGTGR